MFRRGLTNAARAKRRLGDEMNVLVVSPGGMGCTFTIKALGALGLTMNDHRDGDGLKHHFDPLDSRYSVFSPDRVIYIWNDPLTAVMSLNRRGWLTEQRRKLTGRIDECYLGDLWNETISRGRDSYGIEDHFVRWSQQRVWTTCFIDFRHLRTERDRIAIFLNLPSRVLKCLEPQERAQYDLSVIPEQVKGIYRALDDRVVCDLRRAADKMATDVA